MSDNTITIDRADFERLCLLANRCGWTPGGKNGTLTMALVYIEATLDDREGRIKVLEARLKKLEPQPVFGDPIAVTMGCLNGSTVAGGLVTDGIPFRSWIVTRIPAEHINNANFESMVRTLELLDNPRRIKLLRSVLSIGPADSAEKRLAAAMLQALEEAFDLKDDEHG